jgi:hypothetical protein
MTHCSTPAVSMTIVEPVLAYVNRCGVDVPLDPLTTRFVVPVAGESAPPEGAETPETKLRFDSEGRGTPAIEIVLYPLNRASSQLTWNLPGLRT